MNNQEPQDRGHDPTVALQEAHRRIATLQHELEDARAGHEDALQRLKDMQSQLVHAEKMSAIGQLTAGIAHEINNPINFVSGNISPLRRDVEDLLSVLDAYRAAVEEQGLQDRFTRVEQLKADIDMDYVLQEMKQLLEGIGEGAGRTAEIVKNLRNFSRHDEGVMQRSDIHSGLESTLTLLQNMIKNKITVHKNYDDLPEIECFPGQLNQVWMNLLVNAIQAIAGQGELRIATGMNDGKVRVRISDNGAGMKDEVKARIFEPFFTTKGVGEGTGLGLSISYGIVEKHHGTIAVESALGRGTTFTVNLPVTQPT